MTRLSARNGYVVPAGAGDTAWLGRIGAQFKLSGDDTGGALAILEHPVRPGVLVHPHIHAQQDEYSYVLAGTIGARVGDLTYDALGPGDLLCKPRGVPHTFWNPTGEEARLLEIVTPAGLERFFSELGPLVAGEPDFEAIGALTTRHGLTFPTEWIDELTARYGLALDG